ncbi:MAG: hypothetical protein QM537_06790 [Candidatus Symbiobacter sp.]|nr:hypothetical protein [Candidatus Symbiobacter sp.]
MSNLTPHSEEDLVAILTDPAVLAGADGFALSGGGSKEFFGQLPMEGAHTPRNLRKIDLSALSGIKMYEPEELVMNVAAATPIAVIERELAKNNQALAFAPPDWSWMGGQVHRNTSPTLGGPTLGGVVACNISGSERLKMGAARDHVLGFRAVNGQGGLFKSGGRVVKNVTGYDLSKLMSGSFGTLAGLSEITVKIWPQAESEQSLILEGLSDAEAARLMAAALNSPHDVLCAAHLPGAAGRYSAQAAINQTPHSQTLLRIAGYEKSVAARIEALRGYLIAKAGQMSTRLIAQAAASQAIWQEISAGRIFARLYDADRNGRDGIWRISLAPQAAPVFMTALRAQWPDQAEPVWYYDWGGGLVWLYVAELEGDGFGQKIRRTLAAHGGGHATLLAASAAMRQQNLVFEPLSAAAMQLVARVKHSFDPKRRLNPGRIYSSL